MKNRDFVVGLCGLFLLPVFCQAYPIETVIRLKERVSMEKLAQDVLDPSSSRYQKFYTPREIRKVAAPTKKVFLDLLSNLESKGFTIVSQSQSHLFITISGEQALYEQVFSTKIENVAGLKALHRAVLEPRIPDDLSVIASITGLDNMRSSRHHHIDRNANGRPSAIKPMDAFEPPYIQAAYGFDPIYKAGVNGEGQHIAIATYDGFFLMDVNEYYAMEDIKPTPLVDVIEFNGNTDVNIDSATETEIDSEFSGAIAPGAQIHVFTSAHNDDAGELQLFTAILDDNRSKVVNYSWGDCEPNETAQHVSDMSQVFARAVAQGVNVMVASGDAGAEGCPVEDDILAAKYNATFPASIPYVVAVGGTTIEGGSNDDVSEDGWVDSSGGVSALFDLPSWQQGFQSPFTKRSLPDVAFNADPNTGQNAWVHLDSSSQSWEQYGGTSIAAPQWAGFLALVGQARAGKAGLGYLNPIIYGMSASQRAATFRDVTRGNNGGYKATTGWDAVTGWGSLRASALLDYLAGL